MSSSKSTDSYEYYMKHANRGQGIIINNTKFKPHTRKDDRLGSDKDAICLYELLEGWDFDTNIYHNRSTSEMLQIMKKVAQKDHGDSDAFILCILSHGDDGVVYGTDGIISLQDLTSEIKGEKCPSLAGKPKIFIIQAGRGTIMDRGYEVADAVLDDSSEDEFELPPPIRLPTEADCLYYYSTVPGQTSWRNTKDGAFFIRAIYEICQQKSSNDVDLLSLLTRVNQRVAYHFSSNSVDPQYSGMKQMPSLVSTLTRLVYLHPKRN